MTNKAQADVPPKSEFATGLSLLIDRSNLCERKQWADILGVTEAAISQWLNDRTLPSPEFLRMVLDTVRRNANRVPKGIIEQFEALMIKPAAEVTPFADRMGDTIQAYLVKPLLDSFLQVLRNLKADIQERVLPRLTELCMEEAGVLQRSESDPSFQQPRPEPNAGCVQNLPGKQEQEEGVSIVNCYGGTRQRETANYDANSEQSSGRLEIAEHAFTETLKRVLSMYRTYHIENQFSAVRSYFRDEHRSASMFAQKQLLSWVIVALDSACEGSDQNQTTSPGKLTRALAESAVRFGNDAQLAYSLVQDCLEQEKSNIVTLFNSLNMSVLAREEDYARSTWFRFLNEANVWPPDRSESAFLVANARWPNIYRHTLILAGDPRALSTSDLQSIDGLFGEDIVISAVSPRKLRAFDEEAYMVRPTLAGWCDKSCAGFLISDSLRKGAAIDVFVYGPMQELVKAPGIPTVRIAIALAQLGFTPGNSWSFANQMHGSGVLIFIHSKIRLGSKEILRRSQRLPYGFSVLEGTKLESAEEHQYEAARAIGAGI